MAKNHRSFPLLALQRAEAKERCFVDNFFIIFLTINEITYRIAYE